MEFGDRCKVFTTELEQSCIDQIKSILKSPAFETSQVRFMPDVHTGVGVPIGFTAQLSDKVIPNVIGLDIGCGVTCFCLGNIRLTEGDFKELDKFIRASIPFGLTWRKKPAYDVVDYVHGHLFNSDSESFMKEVKRVCSETKQSVDTAYNSLGTLGGGNHFLEVDEDDEGVKYLLIHSGSRGFGLKVAKFYQELAKSYTRGETKKDRKQRIDNLKKTVDKSQIESMLKAMRDSNVPVQNNLEFLVGADFDAYIDAMKVAQKFAKINRHVMGSLILQYFGLKLHKVKIIESIHNYINFDDGVIRKGAISAHKGEDLVIPLNMAEGAIIGVGKGNPDWNNSAPHGAGRVFSRTQAKANISMDDYRDSMKGVWSSCINTDTLDESPMAYKSSSGIIQACEPAVEIRKIIKPVYNFKASE